MVRRSCKSCTPLYRCHANVDVLLSSEFPETPELLTFEKTLMGWSQASDRHANVDVLLPSESSETPKSLTIEKTRAFHRHASLHVILSSDLSLVLPLHQQWCRERSRV
jgi:hypothetical protein